MLDKKEVLRLLYSNQIDAVLIGGIAMRLYNSPRVTHDLDLAVRTLDIDKITELMYEYGYYLVTAVENDSAQICLSADEANQWIIDTKSGSTTFIGFEKTQPSAQVALQEIDITTQIDYLFEPGIPVMRLKKNAKKVPIDPKIPPFYS